MYDLLKLYIVCMSALALRRKVFTEKRNVFMKECLSLVRFKNIGSYEKRKCRYERYERHEIFQIDYKWKINHYEG